MLSRKLKTPHIKQQMDCSNFQRNYLTMLRHMTCDQQPCHPGLQVCQLMFGLSFGPWHSWKMPRISNVYHRPSCQSTCDSVAQLLNSGNKNKTEVWKKTSNIMVNYLLMSKTHLNYVRVYKGLLYITWKTTNVSITGGWMLMPHILNIQNFQKPTYQRL